MNQEQDIDPRVLAGQAIYTKDSLRLYDWTVLGLSNRFIWRCPTPRLLGHYNTHVTSNHLDVGVGTGFFLDRCRFEGQPRIALVDLNSNSLEVTAARIARYQPVTYRRNVLEPLTLDEAPFESAGLNYLFHCVPGSLVEKACIFDHVLEYVVPGGTVFGSTILHEGVPRGILARKLMAFYNKHGIFGNDTDTLDDLRSVLSERFTDHSIEVVGCVALFAGRR